MKNITVFFCVIFSIFTNQSVAQENFVNHSMHFYNVEDQKGAIPFLTISFIEITNENAEKIFKAIYEPLNKKFIDMGGIRTKTDYEKLPQMILFELKAITESGASIIKIDFPKLRQGILIDLRVPKKKPI